jgi:hypothetical protein
MAAACPVPVSPRGEVQWHCVPMVNGAIVVNVLVPYQLLAVPSHKTPQRPKTKDAKAVMRSVYALDMTSLPTIRTLSHPYSSRESTYVSQRSLCRAFFRLMLRPRLVLSLPLWRVGVSGFISLSSLPVCSLHDARAARTARLEYYYLLLHTVATPSGVLLLWDLLPCF